MNECQAMSLFNFHSQHNGVDCIESLDPNDRGTERQYRFTAARLAELFECKRDTIYSRIETLENTKDLSVQNFGQTKLPDSRGSLHETTVYDLTVLNKLAMTFIDNPRAVAIRNAFNDVLVKHETQSPMAVLPQDYLSALKALVASEEAKQKALSERDEAVRAKYQFVEGRDAKVCGELGGLRTQNEKLREQVGDSKNWKQAKAIVWLPDYFDISVKGFWGQLGKAMVSFCKSRNIEYRHIESSEFPNGVNVYPREAINFFREEVHRNTSLLQKYRKAL